MGEYNIDAIAPGSPSDDDLRLMFQVLLEDRFKLKYRWEACELVAYDLTVAKDRPKLKAADPNRKGTANRRSTVFRDLLQTVPALLVG